MSTYSSKDVFCLAFDRVQLEFLCAPKYCERRMKLLAALVYLASETDSQSMKRGISIPVSKGKVEISEVNLAAHLGWNRKTVSDYIKAFNEVGIIQTIKDNRTSVHSFVTLAGWLHGSATIRNPLYQRPSDEPSDQSSNETDASESVTAEQPSGDNSQTDISAQVPEPSATERDSSESQDSADGMEPLKTPPLPEGQPYDSGTED